MSYELEHATGGEDYRAQAHAAALDELRDVKVFLLVTMKEDGTVTATAMMPEGNPEFDRVFLRYADETLRLIAEENGVA